MLVPAGAERSPMLCASARRSTTRCARAHERGLATARRRRGRFCARPASSETAIEAILLAAERAGHSERVAIALDPAMTELYDDGVYRFEGKAGRCAGELLEYWPGCSTAIRSSRSRTALAEDDWDGWELADARARRPRAARRRRSLRHEPRAPAARHRRGRRERDPGQGEPDRHADRDAGRRSSSRRRRLHGGDLAPLGRDRGRDDRRPRGRDERRADQDRRAARSERVAKYNQLLRIEEELGDRAMYPGWSAFPRPRRYARIVASELRVERRSSRRSARPRRIETCVRSRERAWMLRG